jgi:hypothetical protein
MPVSESDFDKLSSDIREVINENNEIKSFKIRQTPKGSWTKFAKVKPASGTYSRAIICAAEVLEEAGYVTSLSMDHGDTYNHRGVVIDVSITYEIHKRVLED